jgi:hypothetical protein
LNKTLRITLPIILAGLLLGSIYSLMGTYHQALASGDSISKSWVGRERIKKPYETQSNSSGVILAGLVIFGFVGKGWVDDGHRLPNNGL